MKSTVKFTLKVKENGRISILDVVAIRQLDGSIKTDLYKKPTHSDRYLNICSSCPISLKRGVIKIIIKRLSPIVSDEKSREQEQQSMRHSLERNVYPSWPINQNISETEPVQFNSSKQTSSSKSPVGLVSLTYILGLTEKLKRILNKN